MLESATNNNTAVYELYALLVNRFGEYAILISSGEARLRCFSHILNLRTKDLLYGSNSEAFEFQSMIVMDTKVKGLEFLKR